VRPTRRQPGPREARRASTFGLGRSHAVCRPAVAEQSRAAMVRVVGEGTLRAVRPNRRLATLGGLPLRPAGFACSLVNSRDWFTAMAVVTQGRSNPLSDLDRRPRPTAFGRSGSAAAALRAAGLGRTEWAV